jgi:catechol 2,3-dioxygenase-like lactoylglutathione lyase family enzyme
MRATGVDHVGLVVADLDRSVRFYHDELGLPLLGRGEVPGSTMMHMLGTSGEPVGYADLDLGEGRILELLEPRGRPSGPSGVPLLAVGHLGLRVDDLDRVLERLRDAGVDVRYEPETIQEPDWWAGARCVYVFDPDGLAVELVERPRVARPAASG